jgi:hypothetical protein
MKLTVEIKFLKQTKPSEVALCFDEEGLAFLIKKLSCLRGEVDHVHLMTPSWSGNELTEEKQGGSEYELINHLRLVKI